MQRNGAGVYTASSCFWDAANDGKFIFIFYKNLCYLFKKIY